MERRLGHIEHLKINSLYRNGGKPIFDRGIRAGLLVGDKNVDMSNRERSHHLDTYMDFMKFTIEHGIHPVDLNLWLTAWSLAIKMKNERKRTDSTETV